MNKKVNVTVFASGAGTNFQSLIDGVKNGICPYVRISGLISNKSDSGAIKRALENDIPDFYISRLNFESDGEYNKVLLEVLKKLRTDIIFLSGYLKKIDESIINKYKGNIYNIHPSLLPLHGGHNMYGLRVHEDVIKCKDEYTGATIHLVNEEYDKGNIMCQIGGVPVLETDEAGLLQERVLDFVEHKIIPLAFDIISKSYLLKNKNS